MSKAKTYQVDDRKLTADELYEEFAALLQAPNEPLLRLQADFENFRRRVTEERPVLAQAAQMSVVEALLPVFDNFGRAFATVPKEVSDTDWYGGIQAIQQQFESVLKSLGIERIATVGQEFDPQVHEAISHEPSTEHAENIITEEYEAGYAKGEAVLRHAKVKVSSGKK